MRVMTGTVLALVMAVTVGVDSLWAQAPGQGAPPAGGRRGGGRGGAPPLLMTSPAFEDGGVIPERFSLTATPATSPELRWTQVPPGTQSFLLIMRDLENIPGRGTRTDQAHWILWNIPATATSLSEGIPAGETLADGTKQMGFRGAGYAGPGAPPGPVHHYVWELFALDIKLDNIPTGAANAVREAIHQATEGHVLGKAVLVGRYAKVN